MKKDFYTDFQQLWNKYQDEMNHAELQDALDTLAEIVVRMYEGRKGEK
jgi:hypothetical protein